MLGKRNKEIGMKVKRSIMDKEKNRDCEIYGRQKDKIEKGRQEE
jgi:hypothetical protein